MYLRTNNKVKTNHKQLQGTIRRSNNKFKKEVKEVEYLLKAFGVSPFLTRKYAVTLVKNKKNKKP